MKRSKTNTRIAVSFMLSLLAVCGAAQPAYSSFAAETITAAAETEAFTIDLQSVETSGSTNAYITVTFGNESSDLRRIADAGVKVNGSKLNYNSSYSYISYANSGDCIVSGNTIQFYTSSLSEGENTVTFTNPDGGEDVSVRLSMSKTGDYWSGYNYTVEVLGETDKPSDEDPDSDFAIELDSIGTSESSTAFVEATFKNDSADVKRIAAAGVKVNGKTLNYNSSAYEIGYANVGDCVVSGQTISFYTSSLSEGENTVTFTNPDGGEDITVKLSKSGSYPDYEVKVIEETTYTAPTITFEKGDGAVRLNWTEVENAESYAVAAFVNGSWTKLAEGKTNTYVIKGLTAGKQYKVAVIAKVNGKWSTDVSNAIIVTPNAAAANYPKITNVEVKGSAFRLTWDAAEGTEKYCIAYFSAGKWKLLGQLDAESTSFTKTNVPAGTYKVVVGAKVGGKWDISKLDQRAVNVTIK
ncbi:hypothetical protein SAMN02910447_02723 [Ruminococcus sp. YE71]|uniref:fibronectin type III domain-containing protein n=1 Tax=unclassified Ruminococcus TaxID=2608920 RepID=UPI000884266E|nr:MULTISPECIES: fibronectin type III domain-containing protein [unclassified Ruminococcus]SDA26849.1 hypothetical protein SAMN02910446_02709 [Ruminococcus sp. YE78]SFW44607.1 hypothetical protein SAMN02910447_02723 [Ruminococcus sp. YE71]